MNVHEITAADLHRAADLVPLDADPRVDAIAEETAAFIAESDILDERGDPFPFEFQPSHWFGYGVMLGYLLARDEVEG